MRSGLQTEVIVVYACQMEEIELADDGGTMLKTLEDDGMGCSRWRSSSHERTSIYSGMEDYDFVKKQKCMWDEG